jgi:hypothetical protein
VPPPPALVEALQAQSDLRQLPTEGGVIAFANVAWHSSLAAGGPAGAVGSGGAPAPAWPRELGLSAGLLVVLLAVAEGIVRRRRRRRLGLLGAPVASKDIAPEPPSEPTSEPAPEPPSEPIEEDAPEPLSEPTSEPEPEPPSEPTEEPAPEPTSEPASSRLP